ncbi:hypothetical protein DOTSEDRAFT_73234 [Dothistroma septosporum NZE10]|uniref:Uncharacterized protein n=1 Tax=Dothistroma septosporum (strain NZE10 / CBS 128990) TaxID=675120 RepID=N1PIA4_DOTSN|nr:hypothetical protein DOTSEDRAFT_73234 [Dothistroma septosporum NZE10]
MVKPTDLMYASEGHHTYSGEDEMEKISAVIEAASAESVHEIAFEEVKHVKQGLHQRHIQMITLA